MNPSYIDADDSILGSDTWGEESNMETIFQNMHSILSHSQPIGLPDMVSTHNVVTADEEFLEIKDLNDPITSNDLDDISNRNLTFDTDEFYDPYEHFDANMYAVQSMGLPIEPITPHLHLDNYSYEDQQNHALHVSSQLWAHEETYNLATVATTNEVASTSPPKGTYLYQ